MNPPPSIKALNTPAACLCALGAVASFTLAYAFTACAILFVVFLACLFRLAWLPLHGRIVPMRAAEYSVPVFGVCRSDIPQFVDGYGRVQASAPFPGDGAMLAANLELPVCGRMPPDRWLARWSVAVVIGVSAWLAAETRLRKLENRRTPATSSIP